MAQIDDIKAQYGNLFNAGKQQLWNKYQSLKDDTSNQINDLNSQVDDTNKQYADQFNDLGNQQTSDVNAQNNLKQQGDQNYLQQSNQVAAQNTQQTNRIQQWMASHNLLNSGENVDAMLQGQSNLNNGLQDVNTQNNKFDTDVAQKIQDLYNTYAGKKATLQTQQQEQVNTLNNNINALKSKLAGYDNSYNNDLGALESQNDANMMDAINKYNQALQQQEFQRQLQAQQETAQRQLAAQQQAAENYRLQQQLNADGIKQQQTAAAANQLGYKDYFNQGNNMLNSTYLDEMGNKVNRYGNNDVLNWVKGLNMSPDDKARLANDLGLQNSQQTNGNLYNYVQGY